MSPLARIRATAPPSAVAAGLIAVTVGVTSAAALVFTAARAAGADAREVSSWMLALGVGIAVTCVGLSLQYKAPVVTSWSTPGAALLATSLSGVSMAKAVGAFVFSAALIVLSGLTGWFARIMDRIPVPLASALLGGVLLEFGTGLFSQMGGSFAIAFPVFVLYLLARRLLPATRSSSRSAAESSPPSSPGAGIWNGSDCRSLSRCSRLPSSTGRC